MDIPIDPNNLPDDLPDDLKKHIIKHAIQHDQIAHEVANWLEDQNVESLRILKGIMTMVSMSENPPATGHYYIGLITALQTRSGLCLGCGRNHAEEVTDMAEAEPTESQLDRETLMNEYQVEDIPNQFPNIRCVNCLSQFSSLEDRMLRKPGVSGCAGCQQKQKWG